jgi:multimeric flavodoxin WrbA
MEQAGASIELIYVSKLKIRPCIGCFKCWGETIGECFIGDNDDMKGILTKLRETDILILATPVHAPLPGAMQNFINRMVPLVEPILEFRAGRTRAKPHDDVNFSKIVGLITGGWCELANLDVGAKIIEELTELFSFEYIEPILRPHGIRLRNENELNQQILNRIEKVGSDLILQGKVDAADLAFIRQPLMNCEEFIKKANENYLKRKAEQQK